MNNHQMLPVFKQRIREWAQPPTKEQFLSQYVAEFGGLLDPLLEDFSGFRGFEFHGALENLDWPRYRAHIEKLDVDHEWQRIIQEQRNIEDLFEMRLQGDCVLFGSFGMMDGYARFHQGRHCVYLGVDESFLEDRYLNILESHELTHVARESQASVWAGFGLSLMMTHDEFVANQPVIEHVFSEGFSCAVSQWLHPEGKEHHYCYQSEDSISSVFEHREVVDSVVHRMIKGGLEGQKDVHYRKLYNPDLYEPIQASYVHYVWALEWVKQCILDFGGHPKHLLKRTSHDLFDHAMSYRLPSSPLDLRKVI